MKVVIKVKPDDRKGMECVENKFLKLPNIQKYEVDRRTEDGFIASVEMDDGFVFKIYAYSLQQVFPSTVMQLIGTKNDNTGVRILISPYISDRTAQICEENGMGYFDYAGNCWFVGHSIYLSERGNKNPQPKQRSAVSIFERIVKIQMNSGLLHLGGGEELVKGITVCYDLLPREVWE